jgi:hypothetical protein
VITGPDPKSDFQVLALTDPYTYDDWREALAEALAAPAFIETRLLLVDRRSAEPVSLEFVDEMVRFFSDHRGALTGTRAAVVTSNEAAYSMARLLQQKSRAVNPEVSIETFRSYQNARIWLVGI